MIAEKMTNLQSEDYFTPKPEVSTVEKTQNRPCDTYAVQLQVGEKTAVKKALC
jgi:hypothetical protein